MSGHSIKDICRIDNLKIKNKNLINQLSRDELLYIYLHLLDDAETDEHLGDLEFPLTLEDFETAKSRMRLKKIKREGLIHDILSILTMEDGVEESIWFDMSVFTVRGDDLNCNKIYMLIFNLMTKYILEEIKGMKAEEITKYTVSLSSYARDTKPEYNCIRALCGISIADKLLIMKNAIPAELLENKNTEQLEDMIFELQESLVVCLYNNYTLVCDNLVESMNKEVAFLNGEIGRNKMQLEERNRKIKELKEAIKNLNKQLKDFEKFEGFATVESNLNQITKKIDNIENVNLKISNEFKEYKDNIVKTFYENQIENYITKVTDLKKELALKTAECKTLKKSLNSYENELEDKFIEYVENNGLSEKFKTFLASIGFDKEEEENLMEAYIKGEYKLPEEIERNSEMILDKVINQDYRRLGYVTIENDRHYINFTNGSREELTNLSDKVYLVEGQFVIVDENFGFSKTTASKYEDNGISMSGLRIGTVESVDPIEVRVGDEYITPGSARDFNGVYRINQVVGLNNLNQIVRAFKSIRFNADTIMKSIKARGIKAYYVLDIFNRGFMNLRDIETSDEDIYAFDTNDIEVAKNAVIFVKNDVVLNAMTQSKFYTTSSYYTDKVTFGYIKIYDGDVRITKQTGEVAIVKNIPESYAFNDGIVIAVDEFNNYLYTVSTDEEFVKRGISKKTAKQVANRNINKKQVEIKGYITIVGNPYFKDSYRKSFRELGYEINMLHGYDSSISEIKQMAKDSEALIVNTGYCSHDNFYKIKDLVKKGDLMGKRYVFSGEGGANVLTTKLQETYLAGEVAITK